MGFYGNIVNYLSQCFKYFKVGNTKLSPKKEDDSLTLISDETITIIPNESDNSITFHANSKQLIARDDGNGNITISLE